jgi:hypothetical protein
VVCAEKNFFSCNLVILVLCDWFGGFPNNLSVYNIQGVSKFANSEFRAW